MEKEESNGRKRFFPPVSLGNILTLVGICGACIALYTQVISDVQAQKVEIKNLKENEIKREAADKESRQEIKIELRDVKKDVKDMNEKLDKVLFELRRR